MSFDKLTNTRFDFNDLLIEPATSTDISSRKQVNPFDENGMLPLFTAPMDTVVDVDNKIDFNNNKINVCFPREKKYTPTSSFQSFSSISLNEFINKYILETVHFGEPGQFYGPLSKHYVLIDIANGHMKKMTEAIREAKKKYGDKLYIMAGNVASPGAYVELSNAGADAVRIGIGNGNGCLTTQQTGIGYPMASLIRECHHRSLMMLEHRALIIADGGMKNYSDIIKAIALGADYVMVGSILNKCLESCGETRIFNHIKINPRSKFAHWAHNNGFKLTKRFRGMSTKEVQKNWGNEIIKTSEGVVRIRPVEYTLEQWVTNFEDYLRSAMSYTNRKTLQEFRGNVKFNLISEQSYKRFNK
jgi:IMP dehydrogenase/GMP reductase